MSSSLGLAAARQAQAGGRMMLRRAAAAARRPAAPAPANTAPRRRSPSSFRVLAAAKLIDGKQIAADIRQEIGAEVAQLKARTGGRVPGLAVVLVGERKDSQSYVRSKKKACAEVGFDSFGVDLPETATEEEVLAAVAGFNADPRVHGVLVQLPLPKHVDERRVLDAVSVRKDVDGFHPSNIGALAMRGRDPLYVPCTPKGCIELLERSGVKIKGATAAVVGRSNIVGLPAALLLQNRDATVTMVHSATPDAQQVCARADIVIAACGRAEMVTGDWIKPGAVVIDVGINAVEDSTKKAGHRLVGDVHFSSAAEKASMITPVPGGVGPMTIAMLLRNTLDGAKRELIGEGVAQ
jgi:5,10-methylene-tetrahydrofolate dehydrogenase/methenyl tetrahydrofolate cyclohydrolase